MLKDGPAFATSSRRFSDGCGRPTGPHIAVAYNDYATARSQKSRVTLASKRAHAGDGSRAAIRDLPSYRAYQGQRQVGQGVSLMPLLPLSEACETVIECIAVGGGTTKERNPHPLAFTHSH